MKKIRKNDEVIVISGRDKGKRGKVMKVMADNRLIVSGVNIIKKHQKPNPYLQQPGGIIEKEAAIQVSNVAIWNPETEKADRVGFLVDEEQKTKIRIFKSTGKPVTA